MKQLHLTILLPLILLASLAAAAAVFIVPMPFLSTAQTDVEVPNTTIPPRPKPDLPEFPAEDWNQLASQLEAARAPAIGVAEADEPEPVAEEKPEENPGQRQIDQSMLNGLQWTYVGSITEPSRIVACIDMDGRQSWIIEGETILGSSGLNDFEVMIREVKENEITIQKGEATRTLQMQSEQTQGRSTEIAT